MIAILPRMLNAQTGVLPFDETPGMAPVASWSDGNNTMLNAHIQMGIGSNTGKIYVKQWNGLFWVSYPPIDVQPVFYDNENQFSIGMHNGEIYILGSFTQLNKGITGVARWRGNTWESVGGGIASDFVIHKSISIDKSNSFQGQLFVNGLFNKANNLPSTRFIRLENDIWKSVQVENGIVKDQQVINDTLFAGGTFTKIEGVNSPRLAAYTNANWNAIAPPNGENIYKLGNWNNQLVAITNSQVFIRNNGAWKVALNNWNYNNFSVLNTANYNGFLILSGLFKTAGGKTDRVIAWDGNQWKTLVTAADININEESPCYVNALGKSLSISGNFTRFFGNTMAYVARIFPGKVLVQGKIYEDANQNCVFDIGDKLLPNILVYDNLNKGYTSTDNNGNYALVLDKNTQVSVQIYPDSKHISGCKNLNFNVQTPGNDSIIKLDYPMDLMPGMPIQIEISSASGYKARHGFQSNYKLICKAAKMHYPLQLKLRYTKGLAEFRSSLEKSESNDSTVSWIINADTMISFQFRVDPTAFQTGDQLNFKATAISKTQPLNRSQCTLMQEIVSALDPNSKNSHKAQITKADNRLDYHIQFQNLGNDSAVNIHVVDTIADFTPLQYIQITDYSHKNNYQVAYKVRDHALVWSFNNIMLAPKSIAGDTGSSGYILFTSGLQKGLKTGTKINNQAFIYFDYQKPVATNIATTTVIENTVPGSVDGFQLHVYPNPLQDGYLQINSAPFYMYNLTIFAMNGSIIFEKNMAEGAFETLIKLPPMANGCYTVKAKTATGILTQKLVVLK